MKKEACLGLVILLFWRCSTKQGLSWNKSKEVDGDIFWDAQRKALAIIDTGFSYQIMRQRLIEFQNVGTQIISTATSSVESIYHSQCPLE